MPEPTPVLRRVLVVAMVALAVAVRLHNVAVFPSLRAPDGFGHFTYIWHLASTGRVPLAMAGWSFFHPPLYYAWMAGVWNAFTFLEPASRLKLGTAPIALLGLLHSYVAWRFVRRRLPGLGAIQLAVPGFLLFLPVQLYSAGYLGNEALSAVLASLSMLVLLAVLDRPTPARAAGLGVMLGLAMLTKFTGLAIVAGCFATIALRSLLRRELVQGAKLLAVVAVVMLVVCGPFYARNVEVYGNPFQMSRDTLAVRRVENIQSQGQRGLLEYVLFDPMVIVRPQWPRGLPITGDIPAEVIRSPLRESVWTGVFANTFFDAVGGQVLPLVTLDNGSRHAGQVMLALAVVPTLLVLLGLVATLRQLRRDGWSDEDVSVLLGFAAVIGVFILGTKSVPMHAAVKATYLAPAWAMLGYWLGRGLDSVGRRSPVALGVCLAICASLSLASVTVFTLGRVVGRGFLAQTDKSSTWQNAYGVVAYAGGDKEDARRLFDAAAASNWHLGYENASVMAAEEGRTLEALYELRLAAKYQPRQSFGLAADRQAFEKITQAEYQNSAAVRYESLGWLDAARTAVARAEELDPTIPEIAFDRGVLDLERLAVEKDFVERRKLVLDADAAFEKTLALDPAFHQAWGMRAVVAAFQGRCDDAKKLAFAGDAARAGAQPRAYPVETGTGDLHSSALKRRIHIEELPAPLRVGTAVGNCRDRDADSRPAPREKAGPAAQAASKEAVPGSADHR